MKNKKTLLIVTVLSIIFFNCSNDENTIGKYPVEPVSFAKVKLNDSFWAPRIRRNFEVTIPIAIQQCYSTGRVDNFKIAGGLMEGKYKTQMPFDDTDIYKLIEAASYSLQNIPDPALEAKIDTLIEYVVLAQEDDGYLYTSRTIDPLHPHPWADITRWTGAAKGYAGSHELYNCGHLFEAAVAHYASTGKTTLLNVAIKTADLLVKDFGPDKLEFGPGHQVVEMGLVKMYNATGKIEYLEMARFFLDIRGPGGEEYSQAHQKVIDQREIVGHAVRATYMYAGMADVAAMYHDEHYKTALNAIWENLVTKKMYVTGGIGSGGGNEGFDIAYKLPNMSAYCETCASVGDIYWNYRMFLSQANSKYIDVLERTMYNSFLSGVSLSGDRFFYPNVLESLGQHERGKWFGTACCPPNVARTLPSLPGYFYAKTKDAIYINLYASGNAEIDLEGNPVEIIQETSYPWEGTVKITVNPSEEKRFKLMIRIPGWINNQVLPGNLYSFADNVVPDYSIKLNGKEMSKEPVNGYAIINNKWKKGDKLELEFDMVPRIITAIDSVEADRNKIAIQRGPIVYAAEWPDVNDGKVLSLVFNKEKKWNAEFKTDKLNGVMVIKTYAKVARSTMEGSVVYNDEQEIELIPYYSWNNRGPGEMMVWLPINEKSMRPLPAPTIASTSEVSGSRKSKTIVAINDQLLPENSIDHSWPFYHWWPKNNSWEWVQYDFNEIKTVSSSKIYWFDDGPFGGCRVPVDWKIMYMSGGKWNDVRAKSTYDVVKDDWSKIEFIPVKTKSLKLMVKLPEQFSTGIHEWEVN